MAKLQQTELAATGPAPAAPIPEDNLPGHHPDHEQDKPTAAFVAKAKALAHEAQKGPAGQEPVVSLPAKPPSRAGSKKGPTAPPAPPRPAPSPGGASAPEPPAVGPLTGRRVGIGALIPAVALVDALRRPPASWEEIGESRTMWLARIAVVPFGNWRYESRVKPRLAAAELAQAAAGG